MKRLLALAAFLLASSAAQAQYTFQFGDRTIRIDPHRGTISIPGVYDNTGRKSKRAHDGDQGAIRKQKQAPQQANVGPQAPSSSPPADTTPALIPQAVVPAEPTATTPAPVAATTGNPPADTAALSPSLPASPGPAAEPNVAPKPAVAIASPPAATAPAPAAVRDPNTPIGVWLTEEKESKIRIEQCGANLCGYSLDVKSDQKGERVLIDMKPGKDLKWSGQIFDPNTGSRYDSTIALRGPDKLRVQGCAFGGMFCGGQTWTRAD